MTKQVFISYRRADAAGNARAFYRDLRRALAADMVYYDNADLAAGELFRPELDEAVRGAQVVLALVGPEWATVRDAQGRLRLHQDDDVVRREIGLALACGKQVIPVLLESAALPEVAALPGDLRPLFDRDAHPMPVKLAAYEAALQQLIGRVCALLGMAPPTAEGQALVERDKLPLLCDRSLQNDAAADAIRAELRRGAPRPIVLVLHGRTEEEHHAFVDRIESFSLPRLLQGKPAGRHLRLVRIHERLPLDQGPEAFARRLREKLAAALQWPEEPDSDTALLAGLRRAQISALVVALGWSASELAADPAAPLRRLADYWHAFPAGSGLLLGCVLCLKYDRAPEPGLLKRWFGGGRADAAAALRQAVAASKARGADDPALAWCVAEELPSVELSDLDRWLDAVSEFTGRLPVTQQQLQQILGGDRRPMEGVRPELERLLGLG